MTIMPLKWGPTTAMMVARNRTEAHYRGFFATGSVGRSHELNRWR